MRTSLNCHRCIVVRDLVTQTINDYKWAYPLGAIRVTNERAAFKMASSRSPGVHIVTVRPRRLGAGILQVLRSDPLVRRFAAPEVYKQRTDLLALSTSLTLTWTFFIPQYHDFTKTEKAGEDRPAQPNTNRI